MIEAEDFRRASQRTRIRDRLDEPEFVPAEVHVHASAAVCLLSFVILPPQSTIRQVVRLAGRVLVSVLALSPIPDSAKSKAARKAASQTSLAVRSGGDRDGLA